MCEKDTRNKLPIKTDSNKTGSINIDDAKYLEKNNLIELHLY